MPAPNEVCFVTQIAVFFALAFISASAATLIEMEFDIYFFPLTVGIACLLGLVAVILMFCKRNPCTLLIVAWYAPIGAMAMTPALTYALKGRYRELTVALYLSAIVSHIALIAPTFKLMRNMEDAERERLQNERVEDAEKERSQKGSVEGVEKDRVAVEKRLEPQTVHQPQGWVQVHAQPQTTASQQGGWGYYLTVPAGSQPAQPQALCYPAGAPCTTSNSVGAV